MSGKYVLKVIFMLCYFDGFALVAVVYLNSSMAGGLSISFILYIHITRVISPGCHHCLLPTVNIQIRVLEYIMIISNIVSSAL